jgi:hypothetical protein
MGRPVLRRGPVTPALRPTGPRSHSPPGARPARQDAEAGRGFRAAWVLRVPQDAEVLRLEEPELLRLEAAARLPERQGGSAQVSVGPPQPALKAGLELAQAGWVPLPPVRAAAFRAWWAGLRRPMAAASPRDDSAPPPGERQRPRCRHHTGCGYPLPAPWQDRRDRLWRSSGT